MCVAQDSQVVVAGVSFVGWSRFLEYLSKQTFEAHDTLWYRSDAYYGEAGIQRPQKTVDFLCLRRTFCFFIKRLAYATSFVRNHKQCTSQHRHDDEMSSAPCC